MKHTGLPDRKQWNNDWNIYGFLRAAKVAEFLKSNALPAKEGKWIIEVQVGLS